MVKQIPHDWLWSEHPKPSSDVSFAGIKQAICQLRVPACRSTSLQAEQFNDSSKRYGKRDKLRGINTLRRLDMFGERDDDYDCRPRNSVVPEIERLEASCTDLQLENENSR